MSAIMGLQIRAARAILRWRAEDLANAAHIGVATVRRAEAVDGATGMTESNARAVRSALEDAGIKLVVGVNGPGVTTSNWQPSLFDDDIMKPASDSTLSMAGVIAQQMLNFLREPDPLSESIMVLWPLPHGPQLVDGLHKRMNTPVDGVVNPASLPARTWCVEYLAKYLSNLSDGLENPIPET